MIAQFSLISLASIKSEKSRVSQAVIPSSITSIPVSIKSGSSLQSPNGKYKFVLETSGQLNLFSIAGQNGKSIDNKLWSANIFVDSDTGSNDGKAPYYLTMQADGNLVHRDSDNRTIWSTKTNGKSNASPFSLKMQDDGNLVVYDNNNKAIWNTGTFGKQ